MEPMRPGNHSVRNLTGKKFDTEEERGEKGETLNFLAKRETQNKPYKRSPGSRSSSSRKNPLDCNLKRKSGRGGGMLTRHTFSEKKIP